MNIKNLRGDNIPITLGKLHEIICHELFITEEELRNARKIREKEVVDARRIAMYIGYTYMYNSYKQLQSIYRLNSNQSIQYNLQTTKNLLDTNARFRKKYDRVTERIMYECFPDK